MAYGMYGNLTPNKAGLMDGLENEVRSLLVASGVTSIAPGEPVFVKPGDETGAFLPDDTDATRKFAGVAIISQRSFVGTEDNLYPTYDQISVLEEGCVWVPVASGISAIANKAAYIIDLTSDGQFKKFTDATSGNYDCGCYFKSNVLNGLAVLEVRGLK
jgi:hypothetical protein